MIEIKGSIADWRDNLVKAVETPNTTPARHAIENARRSGGRPARRKRSSSPRSTSSATA